MALITSIMKFSPSIAAIALALSLVLQAAHAGGFRQITFPPIPVADNPIHIDGNLDDWGVSAAVRFDPIPLGSDTDQSPTAQLLRKRPHTADIHACYDAQALYLAVEWQGVPQGLSSGDSKTALTVHVLTDEKSDIEVGSPTGGTGQIRYRHALTAAWTRASPAEAKAACARSSDGKTWTQEVRLPWTMLTENGAIPADGRVKLAFDLSWSDLTPEAIAQIHEQVLHASTFLTASFLTAPQKIGSFQAIGPAETRDWGDLIFVDHPAKNQTQYYPLLSGSTSLFAVKARTPPTPGNGLQGWDPDSFAEVDYAPGFIGDRYSAKFGAMYDQNNLYIAAHFRGTRGIHNTEPEMRQMGFWGGDDLQFRLSNGVKHVSVCGWYDSIRKQPALTADARDLANPFLRTAGARESFEQDADGKGYIQEIVLPWRALTMAPPEAGETWKAVFHPWWAGLNPEFTAYADATLAPRGAIPVRFTLPQSANVTASLFDKQGHLLRQLLKDVHRSAGPNTVYWDGLDQYGKPAPAGSYVIKGLYHPPIGLDYQLTVCNPGAPPWPTADGKGDWLADESSPQAAATDGNWVYLAAPGSEVGWRVIAVDKNGQRQWGYNNNYTFRNVSLSVQGDYLYVLYSGLQRTVPAPIYPTNTPCEGRACLLCFEKHTGAFAKFSVANPYMTIATWPYSEESHHWIFDLDRTMTYSADTYSGQPGYYANDVAETTNALGLAATADRLYVSMFHNNKLLVLDKETGKQIDTIPVQSPVGLYAKPDGALLCVSGTGIVSIDPATKAVKAIIDHGLLAPHEVTMDSKGDIYVSDWGKSFQVKVFSADGRFVRAIGKEGGRPWIGKWDANGMLVPRGIAVTDAGKLWVAEDDSVLDRISVWDSNTGKLIRDYLGPTTYTSDGYIWADPTDPTLFMGMNTFWRLDFDKKTWTPISTAMRRMDQRQPFITHQILGEVGPRTFTHNGRQYVAFAAGGYMVALATTIYEHVGDQLKPVAAVGQIPKYGPQWDGAVVAVSDGDRRHAFYEGQQPDFFKPHAGDYFSWSDLNGDGMVEENEMKWVTPGPATGPSAPGAISGAATFNWGSGTDSNGATYFTTASSNANHVYRVAIDGWTSGGVPTYDITKVQEIAEPSQKNTSIYATPDGRFLLTGDYEWEKPSDAIQCYDSSGKQLWAMAMPKQQQIDDVEANHIGGEYDAPGVGCVLATSLYHGNNHVYLVTTDGLYITCLLDDTMLGPTAAFPESEHNAWQGPDGAEYLENPVNDGFHIFRLTGLNQMHRFEGALDVTEADVALAAKLRELPTAVEAPRPILRVAWLSTPPKIDGDLSDWRMDDGVRVQGSRGRALSAALGRDAQNLYLAYRIDGAQMVNHGANWQAMFTTGDCVDLMLSNVSTGGKPHYSAQEGDERLLMTVFDGKPIAVLYRPVSSGSAAPVMLANARFDIVTQLPSANVAFHRDDGGYTVEASVPLSALGVSSNATDELRGDVGAVFADETGHTRSLRLYYYNKDTGMIADLTTEATLQPGNWGAIEMPLGPNLLKNGDFEEPFASDQTQGWAITSAQMGAEVVTSTSAPLTGSHSLHFEQTAPVTYAATAYNLSDYSAFLETANDGKGWSYASVAQRVPVTPGKYYWFRAHYRTQGMLGGEWRAPGARRGYDSLLIDLRWKGGGYRILNDQNDTTGWETVLSKGHGMYTAPAPFQAPPGAMYADISIEQRAMAEGFRPISDVDDVEFVEAINP